MQSRDNDPYNRTQAPTATSERDQTVETLGGVIESSPPREGILTGSFVWMFVGVLLSAISTVFVMSSPDLLETVTDYYLLVALGGLGLAFGIMFLAPRISPVVALGMFFAYALMMGLVIGVIAGEALAEAVLAAIH